MELSDHEAPQPTRLLNSQLRASPRERPPPDCTRPCKDQRRQRITASGAITKFSTAVQKKAGPRKGRRWETRKFLPSDHLSFDREFSVLYQVSQLRSLTIQAPKIVEADSRSLMLVLSYPRLHWTTLGQRVTDSVLDVETLLGMKKELVSNIELLYEHGVAYNIKENCVFPVKKASGGWVLYLGGWADASFYPFSGSDELERRKTEQLKRIEDHFELLCARASATSGVTGGPPDD